MYNCKNYTEQGGDTTHIGGKMVFEDGAEVEGLGANPLTAPTESTFGGVKAAEKTSAETVEAKVGADGKLYVPAAPIAENQAAAEAASEGDDLVKLEDFNALLEKLNTAGIMAADEA